MRSYRRIDNINSANKYDIKHYIIRFLTNSDKIYRIDIDALSLNQALESFFNLFNDKLAHLSLTRIISLSYNGTLLPSFEIDAINNEYLSSVMSECDGGGGAGGASVGGAMSGGDTGGISAGDTAVDFDGTSVEDVLGKNEPGKGYMGPGNFYIPSKVKVPFHRYEIANGGSKRKKTKKGKNKKYSYEKGMKVVVDMFESDDED